MSILDGLNLVVIEPEPDPCPICGINDTNKGSVLYCDCEFDDHGNTYDCGACSDGLICLKCDEHFKGLDLSISVFY